MAIVTPHRWLLVLACLSGLMVANGSITTFTFAVFLKPVSQDLGISRTVLASGLFIVNLICGVVAPLTGSLTDHWGSRKTLLAGIPMFAIGMTAFALLENSLIEIYALCVLAGALASIQNTVPYAKVISNWFDKERGLALGIAMAGVGLGIAIVPQLTKLMIEIMGWRMAYVGLGGVIILLALFPVMLFVREPPYTRAGTAQQAVGPSATEVFTGEWRFWVMSVGFLLAVVSTNGTLAHVVALLNDRGISLDRSTAVLSTAGISVIVGRIACGWCLDRFYGPSVAVCFLIMPALGNAALASGAGGIMPISGGVLCGIGMGAEVGLIALFASRYFGLRAYGTIYGALFGLFLIANGLGPYLHGLTYDQMGSYEPALIASCGGLLIGALLLASLGPYRFAVHEPTARAKEVDTVEQIGARLGAAQPSRAI